MEDVAALRSYLKTPDNVLEATRAWFAWSPAFSEVAKKMPPYTSFRLVDDSETGAALCAMGDPDLKRAVLAKITGGCANVRNLDGLNVIYTFDPSLCRFDNALVAAEILQHFTANKDLTDEGDHRLDCSAQIPPLVVALDAVLDQSPHDLRPVWSVLDKFFPVKNCDPADVLASVKKSRHFTDSSERADQTDFKFSAWSDGLDVGFMVLKSGDSGLVYARPTKGSF
jgi:hypothetical protein